MQMRLTGKNQAIRRLHTLIALTLMQEGNTFNSRLLLFNCTFPEKLTLSQVIKNIANLLWNPKVPSYLSLQKKI
jgi:hypothetical protein